MKETSLLSRLSTEQEYRGTELVNQVSRHYYISYNVGENVLEKMMNYRDKSITEHSNECP